jgi:hypothetical protein
MRKVSPAYRRVNLKNTGYKVDIDENEGVTITENNGIDNNASWISTISNLSFPMIARSVQVLIVVLMIDTFSPDPPKTIVSIVAGSAALFSMLIFAAIFFSNINKICNSNTSSVAKDKIKSSLQSLIDCVIGVAHLCFLSGFASAIFMFLIAVSIGTHQLSIESSTPMMCKVMLMFATIETNLTLYCILKEKAHRSLTSKLFFISVPVAIYFLPKIVKGDNPPTSQLFAYWALIIVAVLLIWVYPLFLMLDKFCACARCNRDAKVDHLILATMSSVTKTMT